MFFTRIAHIHDPKTEEQTPHVKAIITELENREAYAALVHAIKLAAVSMSYSTNTQAQKI